jgi:hypothetical protein
VILCPRGSGFAPRLTVHWIVVILDHMTHLVACAIAMAHSGEQNSPVSDDLTRAARF